MSRAEILPLIRTRAIWKLQEHGNQISGLTLGKYDTGHNNSRYIAFYIHLPLKTKVRILNTYKQCFSTYLEVYYKKNNIPANSVLNWITEWFFDN